MTTQYHQFFDAALPRWITPPEYTHEAKKYMPTKMLDAGMAQRARVGTPDDASYFVRIEAPGLFRSNDAMLAWGDAERLHAAKHGGKQGFTADADMLALGSHPLGSVAYALGYRAIPGFHHLAAMVNRHELAEDFEAACREWARDADGMHRVMHLKSAKDFLTKAQEELVRPMITEIRIAFVNVACELEQYPQLKPLITPAGHDSIISAVFPPD
jgi:hypothetical protein